MLEQDKTSRIKTLLKAHPNGLAITDISSKLTMNRNTAAKYLDILQISGQVESKSYGSTKVYFLTQRLPVSALVSLASDLVIALDEDDKILFVNNSFCNIFRVKNEDAAGNHIVNIFRTGFGKEILPDIFSDLIAAPEKVHEVRIRRDGQEFYFKIRSIKTVFDDSSRGTTIIMEDITREKMDKIELEAKESRYRGIVEDQTEFILRFLPDGSITFVNTSYCHVMNETAGELLKKRFPDTILPQDQGIFERCLKDLSRKEPVSSFECRITSGKNEPLWVSWILRAMYSDDHKPVEFQAVGHDITEQKEGEWIIMQHVRDMEFLSEKLHEFIMLGPLENIYDKIVSDLRTIVPDSIIFVNSYDPKSRMLTIKSIESSELQRAEIRNALGKEPVGCNYPIDSLAEAAFQTGKLYNPKLSLYEIFFRTIPKPVSDQLEANLGIRKIFSIGFARGDEILGNATIFLPTGNEISNLKLIEMYAKEAAIALQRIMAEEARRKSDEIFHNLTQNSPLPVALIAPDGTYTYINESFSRLFGYDLSDFRTGKQWFRLIFPDNDYRRQAVAIWKSDQAQSWSGRAIKRTFLVRCKNGSVREVVFRPVTLSGGNLCIICEDITERNSTERTHLLLSSIIESTSDAVIARDNQGTIIGWNRAAEDLFGYTESEIIGRHFSLLIPGDRRQEMKMIFRKIMEGRAVRNLTTQRIRKDGRTVDVSVTISPIIDENDAVIGASTIARDNSHDETLVSHA